MSLTAVILDTTPLGLVTQRAGKSPVADQCRTWMQDLLKQGIRIYLPEIADYELRRELTRENKVASVLRLDNLAGVLRYVPITTDTMRQAAVMWALSRNTGRATSDPKELDGDVILCAQVLSLQLPSNAYIVATSNAKHLSQFVPADKWTQTAI